MIMNDRYKNKEWLEDRIINDGLSQREIAKICCVSPTTINVYVKRFDICPVESTYKNEDWLRHQYIQLNKNETKISEELGVSRGSIQYYINKFNIKKSREDIVKGQRVRLIETSMNRFGVPHHSQNKEIRKKIEDTCSKRYGVKINLHAKEVRKKMEGNRIKRIVDGKTLHQISKEYDIPTVSLYSFYNKNINVSDTDILNYAKRYNRYYTDIEFTFKSKLGIDKYNKCIDLDKFQNMRYRPDFKYDNVFVNIDGLYWHSSIFKNKWYHFNMRKDIEKCGLRIFQFRSDEVYNKMEIIKSMLNNSIGLTNTKIGARSCKLAIISQKDANIFYTKTHLMGPMNAKHVGLYYEGKIICMMSYKVYGKRLKIERFSSDIDTIIHGAFSKLLKYTLNHIKNEINDIYYWVDLRYGTGNFLKKHGFYYQRETLGWRWTDNINTYNRLKCRANMDNRNLSEKKYAEELRWVKIYDAGQRLYIRRLQ